MAQGEFTKDEVARIREAVDELFRAIPGRRRGAYLGHLNDILLFLSAAERAMGGSGRRRGGKVEPPIPAPASGRRG